MSDLFIEPKGSKWSVKDLFNSVWMLNKYISVLLVKIRTRIGFKRKRETRMHTKNVKLKEKEKEEASN
jgi:hypothetical protein